jgi:hypothetical protein
MVMDSPSIYERLLIERITPLPGTTLGIATETLDERPINGLRHESDSTTNGWYLWCGEWSDADDFFKPLHIDHISDYLPQVAPYLDLPPGYRFLIDDQGSEDIWFDETLLKI